jgi:dipeptidyl aminopeptidase/acylaminoacyl peptidase
MFRLITASFLICTVALKGASPAPASILTAEELFRASELNEAEISPDGRHLGTIVTDRDDLKNLLVYDLKDYSPTGLRGSGPFEISHFDWLGNDRLVFGITKEKILSWGLYASRIGHLDRFVAIDKFDAAQVVGIPRERAGKVLVWITQSSVDQGRPGNLVELDADRVGTDIDRPGLRSSAVMHAYLPPTDGPVVSWQSDANGELALCTTWSNGKERLHRYFSASKAWADVPLDRLTRPMGMDFDTKYLWVVTISKAGVYELRRMNLDTGDLDTPVLSDPVYDIGAGHLIFSNVSRGLAGVTYTKQRAVSVWFLNAFASVQGLVDHRRPLTDNVLISRDLAERKFLFQLCSPTHPASYELLDLDAKILREIDSAAPQLEGRPLHPVHSVSFLTRDGIRLEGYEALPVGASAEHPVPLVVFVHGGPWVRDLGWFNPVVQFLVSRGYAVFQPNYRGSVGYSPAISHEKMFDFARMQNDVTDATKAILGTGVIDPKRVAIFGGSFGGYLAVAGVAFEDGLYRCAISESGVFDWERLVKSKMDGGRPGEYAMLTDDLGDPRRDRRHLEEISPLEHADRIHVPVLLAHGSEDTIVDIEQSKKLARELRKRGIPCETFFRGDEGHGFSNYENRVAFFHRVEAFLAANLGGTSLTP